MGGKGIEGGVVPGKCAWVRVVCASQRVVVPGKGGRAQHSVGQVWAQMRAIGRIGCSHSVQGVGTAWIGKVHPAIHQVLCAGEDRSFSEAHSR